ncbi:MAG: sphingosine N-acyltransferase lag1 [Sclerophora amabilis]|nr:MAG: sphingosine N-acyltransferase lag1 [Sclerophora amabilis]
MAAIVESPHISHSLGGSHSKGRYLPDHQKPGITGLAPKTGQNSAAGSAKPIHAAGVGPGLRRNKQSLVGAFCAWVVEHQIGIAGNLVLLLTLSHVCLPRSRQHTRKFFELSYYNPESGRYATGKNDWFMVFYWLTIFTGLRAATMDYILLPLARWGGVRNRKGRNRFAEQAWLLLYYGTFWAVGMYLYYNSDYWLDLSAMWRDWPTVEMGGLIKWYYLVQFAFWVQQILVVNIEERRKDYHQMFTHHIITCLLMFFSYGYYQTKVGNVILCLMDVVDIFLSAAKMLKYLHFHVTCDIAFGVFIFSWFVARHVLYLMVCLSILRDLPENLTYGCYSSTTGVLVGPSDSFEWMSHVDEPLRDPYSTVCFNDTIKWMFLTMLVALQVITLIWFGMILGVAWRILNGQTAEDTRSDGEDEEEDVAEREGVKNGHRVVVAPPPPPPPPLEEEVGVEAISLKGRTSPVRRYRKTAGTASGVTLPGHSDRKELLGRIGCDKTT